MKPKTKSRIFLIAVLIGAIALLFAPLMAFAQSEPFESILASSDQKAVKFLAFDWVNALSRPGLIAITTFLLGYALRRFENVSPRFLFLICVLSTAGYVVIGEQVSVNNAENIGVKICIGLIVSLLGLIFAMIAHNKVLALAAKKFPILGLLVAEDVKEAQKDTPKTDT